MKTLQDFPAMKSQAVARQIHWDSLGGVFPTHMPPGGSRNEEPPTFGRGLGLCQQRRDQ